jgi:hypothetical protein
MMHCHKITALLSYAAEATITKFSSYWRPDLASPSESAHRQARKAAGVARSTKRTIQRRDCLPAQLSREAHHRIQKILIDRDVLSGLIPNRSRRKNLIWTIIALNHA